MTKLMLINLNECIKMLVMPFVDNWIYFILLILLFMLKEFFKRVLRLHHTAKGFPCTKFKMLSSAGYKGPSL